MDVGDPSPDAKFPDWACEAHVPNAPPAKRAYSTAPRVTLVSTSKITTKRLIYHAADDPVARLQRLARFIAWLVKARVAHSGGYSLPSRIQHRHGVLLSIGPSPEI